MRAFRQKKPSTAPAVSPVRGSGYQTPKQIRETEDVTGVVKLQPHRKPFSGLDTDWDKDTLEKAKESPLGRLCLSHKPRPLAQEIYQAGVAYRNAVREYRNAKGFYVEGFDPPQNGGEEMDQEELVERIADAKKAVDKYDAVLFRLDVGGPGLMDNLCVRDLEVPLTRREMAYDCLIVLSDFLQPRRKFS